MQKISVFERLADGRGMFAGAGIAGLLLGAVGTSIWVAPGVPGYLGAGLALIMLAIALIDARCFIIPDELNAAGFILALVNAAITAQVSTAQATWEAVGFAVLRGAVLALLFFGLRTGYRRLRGREGIGLGDVKLAAVAGAWLGTLTIPITVQIAALAALAVYGVRHYAMGRPLDAAAKFPFGLFLAPSIWIGWLLEATLLAPW